jgi:hypothetical protein
VSAPRPGRILDAAALLPLAGLFLLLPPAISLFAVDGHVLGIPVIVAYVFGTWLALVACAALIARRLAPRD